MINGVLAAVGTVYVATGSIAVTAIAAAVALALAVPYSVAKH